MCVFLCVVMLCITNTCWGMLPSNLCPSLGLSRCVCLQDYVTCALSSTQIHTPARWIQFLKLCDRFAQSSLNISLSSMVNDYWTNDFSELEWYWLLTKLHKTKYSYTGNSFSLCQIGQQKVWGNISAFLLLPHIIIKQIIKTEHLKKTEHKQTNFGN